MAAIAESPAQSRAGPTGWFTAPAPIRQLFKRFPLHAYDADALPIRSTISCDSTKPRLYVFARDEEEAARGTPSYNPSCLKWQTLLRIAQVDVAIIPSTNHASPSGALPFLLSSTSTSPITGSKIARFANDASLLQTPIDLSSNPKLAPYQALIAHRIRPAWLHALYLLPANESVLASLYLPSSKILHPPQRALLREAATSEILKTTRQSAGIDVEKLYETATEGFAALSTALGEQEWFFDRDAPGVLDAELFAYTYLILDEAMKWCDPQLAACLLQFENLVRHRDRLYSRCWGKS